MKAAVRSSLGTPQVLQLEDVPQPSLRADHEVLVRLKAAGVNPLDTKLRAKPSPYPLPTPVVLGCDGAGIVEAVATSVDKFKPGDEVYFCRCGFGDSTGTYAEYVVVEEHLLAKKPKRLDFVTAAAAPLVLITAWESLHDRAHIAQQQAVLIHGGAGGVGHVAVQLAHQAGARIATTVGSASKATFTESLGAERSILYETEDFVEVIMTWTKGQGVAMALDTVGGATFQQTFAAVRCYGDVVTLLQPGNDVDWTVARQRNLRIGFELMLLPLLIDIPDAQQHQGEILRQCAELIDARKLNIHVAEVFPLAEAAKAHEFLERAAPMGKVVLSIDD
ncbi:MAG: zinc-binding dehydrogenase [Gammaproteobacteria bacterium]